MTWVQKDEYYEQNGDWTICRTGKAKLKYGLWKGSVNHGWFDKPSQAIEKWKELVNA